MELPRSVDLLRYPGDFAAPGVSWSPAEVSEAWGQMKPEGRGRRNPVLSCALVRGSPRGRAQRRAVSLVCVGRVERAFSDLLEAVCAHGAR